MTEKNISLKKSRKELRAEKQKNKKEKDFAPRGARNPLKKGFFKPFKRVLYENRGNLHKRELIVFKELKKALKK